MMQRSLGWCSLALWLAACSGGPGPYQTPPGEDPGTPTVSDDKPEYADDPATNSSDLPMTPSAPNDSDRPSDDQGFDSPSDESDCVQLCNAADALACMEEDCVQRCSAILGISCGPALVKLSMCVLTRIRTCQISIDDGPEDPDTMALTAQCPSEWSNYQACGGVD